MGVQHAIGASRPANSVPTVARTEGSDVARLLELARARPELIWSSGRNIAEAKNAHATNTREQMAAALRDDFDWLEGDVSLVDGTLVMRHVPEDPVVDLNFEQWLKITGSSGRGVKVDLKKHTPVGPVLDAVERSGIPEHRLMFNVAVLPTNQLLEIRRRFPKAIISLSPNSDAELTARDIGQLQIVSRIVGGPMTFPLRLDTVEPNVVRALRPYGQVGVWNAPELTNPRDTDHDRLRAMGVNGVIDFVEPRGTKQRLASAAVGSAVHVAGRDPVMRALDALGFM